MYIDISDRVITKMTEFRRTEWQGFVHVTNFRWQFLTLINGDNRQRQPGSDDVTFQLSIELSIYLFAYFLLIFFF